MAEYIEKNKAIKELYEVYDYEFPTASGGFDEYARMIVPNTIKNMPAADVAPVRHGRWDDEHRCTVCHNEAFYKISNIRPVYDYDWEENLVKTGDYIWDTEWFETTYCPYCGAQMDEKED